jgi:hypothetical protein
MIAISRIFINTSIMSISVVILPCEIGSSIFETIAEGLRNKEGSRPVSARVSLSCRRRESRVIAQIDVIQVAYGVSIGFTEWMCGVKIRRTDSVWQTSHITSADLALT